MPSQPDSGLKVAGTGVYLPARILSNHDLEKLVDTSDEWIMTRTGIKERRIASEQETSTFMGVAAAKQALAHAKTKATDLDLILTATVTPDSMFPSSSCRISAEIRQEEEGNMESGVTVAVRMRSRSVALVLAWARACFAAATPMKVEVSCSEAIRRSLMPVRVMIHSSLVSTSFSRSWLERMRAGR